MGSTLNMVKGDKLVVKEFYHFKGPDDIFGLNCYLLNFVFDMVDNFIPLFS